MKQLLPLLLAGCLTLSLEAQTSLTNYTALGQLWLVKLDSAPFPHPQRAEGHQYGKEFYPTDKHYRDNTVGIFVPKGFRRTGSVDFVVHFHGWHNHVEKVLDHYQLIEQFVESGRNAILVVPQGPYDAPDSFDGKLEDENGFKRFMAEVMGTLRGQKVIGDEPIGSIVLSGHSGGYQVISSIVAQGGLTEHVREVWLFDALYGRTEKFAKWFEQSPQGRLIDIYTADGGTKVETEKWMEDLKQKSAPFLAKKEAETGPEDLRKNRLIFIFTELEHDEVPMKHRAFAEYLRTSSLVEIKPLQEAK